MNRDKYYEWNQAGNLGIVKAPSIAAARKEAERAAPYNSGHFPIRVAKATREAIGWYESMGGRLEPMEKSQ